MNNQISARLPVPIYHAFQKYLGKSKLNRTQIIVNAIANYIGYQAMENTTLDSEIYDIRIDVQDIESFLERIDKRLTKVEKKLNDKKTEQQTYKLTEYDKQVILKFIRNCHKTGSIFTIKDLLKLIKLDENNQGLQQQIAYLIKSQGWYKARKTINKRNYYYWVKDSEGKN